MNFDQFMNFVNNLLKCDLYTNLETAQQLGQSYQSFPLKLIESVPPITDLKENVRQIKIHTSLLNALEKEYDVLTEKINQVIEKQSAKNPSKK